MKLEELVGKPITEEQFDEAAGKKDKCYHKVKARYDVWPSAYASGALVKCRKVGAANWGNKSKKEGVNENKAEKEKIFNMLVKRGDTAVDARYEVDKSYDFVKKRFPKASVSKKAEIISSLSKFESVKKEGTCGYGVNGKLGEEPAGPNLRKKIKNISKHEEGVNEMDSPMFKITYKDSRGAKKTDIMRAKNSNLAKRDFNALHQGRGFKILKVVKESVNEKKGDFLDSLFPKAKVDKAIKIAKKMSGNMSGAVKAIEKFFPGMTKHTKVQDALRKANEGLKENTNTIKVWSLDEKCWKGYEKKGMKTMFGKRYPNCVKKEGVQTNVWMGENELYYESNTGESGGYTFEYDNNDLNEAEYQGRKVKLGKIMQGDAKKFKVYVKNPKGNVVKVNFGQGGDAKGGTMRIRKSNPKARKAFRSRHNCDNPGPRHKARYWSCRKW